MDVVLIILGIICIIAGFLGSVLPILPGPPISYLGLLFLQFTDKVHFSAKQLILWLFIVIIVQLLDYITPILGAKRYGGSKWGTWGCMIGTFIGIFFYPPWGILLGPFLGAFVGEILGGKDSRTALKSGFGTFIGFLFGTILKLIVCGMFAFYFIKALF